MAEKKDRSFVVSDESKNSYGLRIITAGMQNERFLNNPVMLDLHDRSKVLGRWENLRVEGKVILADDVWDEEDPDALKIKGKVDRGFIKGCSIGIEPIKTVYNDADDTIEVTEWILKEISIASVPSNENALVLYDAKGEIMNKESILTFAASSKPQQTTIDNMKDIKLFVKTLNLSDSATETDVLLAVQSLNEKNIELADTNKKLEQKIKEAEKSKGIALVDGAISSNKILPAEREDYIALADSNYETTKKLLDAKKPFVGLSSRVAGDDTGADKFAQTTKDWTFDDFHKKGKVVELMDKDYDRYADLYFEKYKVKPKAKA